MTATGQARYVDKGTLLGEFAGSAIVVCPKCSGPAVVSSRSSYVVPYVPRNGRIRCLKCPFVARASETKWLGPVIGVAKERCRNCGFKWLKRQVRRRALTSAVQQSAHLVCPSCGLVNVTSLEWMKPRVGLPIDPVFGLPLWLKISCCSEALWAYDRGHLSILRDYVRATLRERTMGSRGRMIARLPKWLAAGKNRDTVLACLTRLEKKLDAVDELR